jgi:putative sigma-54 modulation protein
VDIQVHGKNTQVGDEFRVLAIEKVAHAMRILDGAVAADVELTESQNPRVAERYRVEITSRSKGQTVRVEGHGGDDRTALDRAVAKFERQLRRLKERLVQRSRQSENKALNQFPAPTDEEEDQGRRIVRTKRFAMRPMTPEEAALEMEMLGHDFFFFLDADSGQHCVLYHRRDGSLGLIEPE